MSEKKELDFRDFKAQRETIRQDLIEHGHLVEKGSYAGAIYGLCDQLDKQDELLQMLIHDIISLSDERERQRAFSMNIGSSLSALTIALEENGILESAKVQEVWDRTMKPTLERLEAEAKKSASNIIVPKQNKIIIP